MLSVQAGQILTTSHSGSTTDNVGDLVNNPYEPSPTYLEISFNGSPIGSSLSGWVAPSDGTIGFRHTSDDVGGGIGNNAGTHYIDVQVCNS